MRVTAAVLYWVSLDYFNLSFWYYPFSQKDLENLKAEVQRRQQLQELGKIEEPIEDTPLELEDKIPVD